VVFTPESVDLLLTCMLRKGVLSQTDLRGPDLARADLTDSVVTDEQLADARALKGATLPKGTMHG
jgi:uncharacterized protein YjbI with pentapeptide repeats